MEFFKKLMNMKENKMIMSYEYFLITSYTSEILYTSEQIDVVGCYDYGYDELAMVSDGLFTILIFH